MAAIGSQYGVIKDVLESGIRRVTVKIRWTEGKKPEEVALVAFYTDVRRVDQAIQIATPAAGGPDGGAPTSGAPPSGTPPSGTPPTGAPPK
jgi:hypothetical protein